MITIDFTNPTIYKDVTTFYQGNLSINNASRCKIKTGTDEDLKGASISCKFNNSATVKDCKIIDEEKCIIDIVYPSDVLIVGTNKLEIIVTRSDGSVAQSPILNYEVWQGLE